MADNLKVLGQVLPAATTQTSLYTVPASRSAVVSTLTVCNQGTAGTFRIAIQPAGAALAAVHYLYFDASIGANVTAAFTIGITLATTDIVGVYSSNGAMSFHVYGNEVA